MKSSLKNLLAAALLGVAALPVLGLAADEKTPPPAPPAGGGGGQRGGRSPEQQLSRLDDAVTLTAEQKTKVLAIYKKQADAAQALAPEERREKGPELMKAARDEIRALLTPEQQKKFDAMPQRGPGGGGGGRPPGGGGAAGGDKKE